MRTVRLLVLTGETLAELTAGELDAVRGGGTTTSRHLECPTRGGEPCTAISTAVDPCPTAPRICD